MPRKPKTPPPVPKARHADPAELVARWNADWPAALAVWSRFTKLRPPALCLTEADEKREDLTGSFAMIRLQDHQVVVSLRVVAQRGLENFAKEILAHEIGHHVYCPGDLTDHGRSLARITKAIPSFAQMAPLIANLYYDLLINDRLQRSEKLDMAGVYQRLHTDSKNSKLWTLYQRIYEILWSLPKNSLAPDEVPPAMEGDAILGARLVRVYSREWVRASGKFAALCLPYLMEDKGGESITNFFRPWFDTRQAAQGCDPSSLIQAESDEPSAYQHPALDPDLVDTEVDETDRQAHEDKLREMGQFRPPSPQASRGQYREPFEYQQLLRQLGLPLDNDWAITYYQERAQPHLIRFPPLPHPQAGEPLPEGVETWEFGAPMEQVDWLQTILRSPMVIPGVTTLQRTYDESVPERKVVEQAPDLDLYIDSSGSMPNPQQSTSFLTLAGFIVVLSALRAGAKVQATLWSGTNQFKTTKGFTDDKLEILRILVGYFGGATAFPIHILRETYATERKPGSRPVHILHISDDGITTMYAQDEKKNDGFPIAQRALERAGSGTMVLNMAPTWLGQGDFLKATNQGWKISTIQSWEDLIEFARTFSRNVYAPKARA